jgi:Uri superfamily endonuclease
LNDGGEKRSAPTASAIANLPASPGAYILEFRLSRRLTLEAGRLGTVQLPAGRIRYYGSAYGPGGIRARVARHLDRKRHHQHWHIDTLTARVKVARVIPVTGGNECDLLQRDLATGHWRVAAPGFGSTDCRQCPAHLLREVPIL